MPTSIGKASFVNSVRLGDLVKDGKIYLSLSDALALALENNLDVLNAISWTKGCYVGQEVTARTRYRGLVRRRLQPVRVHGPLPGPGTAVHQGGHEVGLIRSGAGTLALAMLRLDIADPMAAPLVAGPATLIPLEPGWTRG